jgi:hypothetical protein
MYKNSLIFPNLFINVLISFNIIFCMSVPVIASSGITVTGVLLITDVVPGEMLIHKINVSIDANTPPVDVIAQVGGSLQLLDGTIQFVPNVENDSKYSARQFITLDCETLHLEPGVPQEITATIHVPENVGDGGRYALISVKTVSLNKDGVSVASAINVPVFLTIKNSNIVELGNVESVIISEIITGQPVNIVTDFQNTGNLHYKVKGEVTILDPKGDIIDTVYSGLTNNSIVPLATRRIKAVFIPNGELSEGVYSIKSDVMLEDGTILDEKITNFEVRGTYIPPSVSASQTIIPSNYSLLESKDTRISISFPACSVIEPVLITLRNYPLEQLPPLSKNLRPGATCFRVDGLNGLLAKEAQITVGYTEDDLDKAERNPNRLRLAYWNEVENQWSVLNTIVDKNKMTLTTSTNHFSIWSVVVTPEQKLRLPLVFGSVIGGCVIVGLFILYLIKKKNRLNKRVILH